FFFFSSRRRHTRCLSDWSSDVCSSDLECGSCSVMLDRALVCSCLVLAGACAGKSVETVEGLSSGATLHPLQQAFLKAGAVQCGLDRKSVRVGKECRARGWA